MVGILCEKPSAARNFAKALGGMSGTYNGEQYIITAARGHLYEFDQPEKQVHANLKTKYHSWDLQYLPWDENDFNWKRISKPDTKQTLDTIKKTLTGCDSICIATDVDPTGEGELLAWEILDELQLHPKKWERMYFTDEAPASIQKAFKTRKTIPSMADDMDFVKADYRSKFDFLTMQFTRIATKVGDGRSVLRQGRLKSAMVLLVGDQLKAISEYKKIPFYENRFRDENGVVYTNPDEERYPDKTQVPQKYNPSTVTVDSKQMKSTAPPKMLDLASLSARLSPKGYKAKDVLAVYQKMYEAQIVSYPRTEDKVITPEQFNEMLPLVDKIANVVGVDTSFLTHRTPRSTHVKTGGAHGANRPGPNVPSSLSALDAYDNGRGLAREIYVTLAQNYLATLAEDYEYEAQNGHVTDYPNFKGSTSVPKKLGWKEIFQSGDDDDETTQGLGTKAEPFIYEGFPPKPTTPTLKWLMKQLEKHDVGTGATRTSIYADVTNDKAKFPLLKDTKGKISMTTFGEMSYGLLPNTHIGSLEITEQLQADMRNIAEKKVQPDICLAKVAQMVRDDLAIMQKNGETMRQKLGVSLASPADYAVGMFNGKQIRFKRKWSTYEFSDDEISKLLNGEMIKIFGVQGKNGPYNTKGRLAEQTYNGRKFYGFKSEGAINDDGTDKVSNVNSADYCEGVWKKKKIRFKRNWGGHAFTDDECKRLLDDQEIEFQATSSKGTQYTAKGKLANQTFNGVKFVGFKPDFNKKK